MHKKTRRNTQLILSGIMCTALAGCSLHNFIPANRFDFPETHEKWLWGNVQGRYQGTTRIELIPDPSDSPPRLEEPKVAPEGQVVNDLGFSVTTGIVKNLDVFLKLPVAPSPPLLGVKYQFLGHSYDKRKTGDWALSTTLAAGYMRQEADVEKGGVPSHYKGESWAFDGAIIAGYRPQRDTLIYGGPFYTVLAAQGEVAQLTSIYNTSGRGCQYGFNTGAAFDFGPWNAAIEVAYISMYWSFSRVVNQVYAGIAVTKEF